MSVYELNEENGSHKKEKNIEDMTGDLVSAIHYIRIKLTKNDEGIKNLN